MLSPARVGRFLRAYLAWVALGPLVMLYGTTVHELTHCAAALASHGTVTELHLLPTTMFEHFVFGWMNAEGGNDLAVKIAPALLSACIATFAYSWMEELGPGRGAKLCFVLFYLVPMFDVAMAVMGPTFSVGVSDLWVLHDQLPALLTAALVFFGVQLWAVPRLFEPIFGSGTLSHAELRALILLFLLVPALRFTVGG